MNTTTQHNSPLSFARILLVEDNLIAQRIPSIILTEAGFDLSLASTGCDACRQIDQSLQQPYDLILLDIGLPDISGFQVAMHIRKHTTYKSTPIIGLTAHIPNKIEPHCMSEIVSKPFTQKLLQQINDKYFQTA